MNEPADESQPRDLSEVEVAVLEFEQSWWKYPAAKKIAVDDKFGWSITRYYQVLGALIETPAALAHDPLTVNRLRRLKAARSAQRSRRGRLDTSGPATPAT